MIAPTIATCCYCGTRAALRFDREDRVELTCRGCGAPLHDMKPLKGHVGAKAAPEPAPQTPSAARAPHRTRKTKSRSESKPKHSQPKKRRPKKTQTRRRKPRRSFAERLRSGAADRLGDLFDDAFDALEDLFD